MFTEQNSAGDGAGGFQNLRRWRGGVGKVHVTHQVMIRAWRTWETRWLTWAGIRGMPRLFLVVPKRRRAVAGRVEELGRSRQSSGSPAWPLLMQWNFKPLPMPLALPWTISSIPAGSNHSETSSTAGSTASEEKKKTQLESWTHLLLEDHHAFSKQCTQETFQAQV